MHKNNHVYTHTAPSEQLKVEQVQNSDVLQWHKVYTNGSEIRLTDSEVEMWDTQSHTDITAVLYAYTFCFL